MKLLPFCLAFLLALTTARPHVATAQNAPNWALALTSLEVTRITNVAIDAANNTFVAGSLRGPATFGTQPLPTGGTTLPNGFLARLDASGNVQWVRYLAAANSGTAGFLTSMVLDAAGNIVVGGSYALGGLVLGAFTLPANANSPASSNGLVAKFDPAGNVLWAQAVTDGKTPFNVTAVATDAVGTVYAAIASNVAPYVGGMGIRMFSATGVAGGNYDFLGVTGIPATSPQGVYASIDELRVNLATGQLGAVGQFQGKLTLRAAVGATAALEFISPPEPQTGSFVMGLAPTGAPEWAQVLTSTGFSQNGRTGSFYNKMLGITPLGTGFAVAGGYLGAGTLAGTTLPGSASSDNLTGVLARFDGQGLLQWTQPITGGGVSGSGAIATALTTDAAGQLHVAGFFVGQLSTNGGGLTSVSGADLLLLRYSAQGQLLGAQRDGSFGDEYPTSLALDATGQPRVAGYFNGTSSFGGTVLATGPRQNGFVARLARTPLATRAVSPAQAALQVFPNPSAGAPELRVNLLPGTGTTTLRLLDALGRPVHTQTIPALRATATVPTAAVAAGHYVLQVIGNEGVATRSVIVE